ncbi:MAG: hypothetical protein ACE5F9_09650 [Phycisphaerae bacterium]
MSNKRNRANGMLVAMIAGAVFCLSNAGATAQVSGRQPTITNQFTTTTGGALQARRPGLFVQQGIAEVQGQSTFLTGDIPDQNRFFHDTAVLVFQNILDSILRFMSNLNLASSLGNLGSLFGTTGGTTGLSTIPNSTTTGPGTSVQIQ